jgi:hypothetical protein
LGGYRSIKNFDSCVRSFCYERFGYSRIRPYLTNDVIKNIEGGSKVTRIVVGNGRHSGINPYRQKLLDEIAILERKWELI